MRRNKIRVCGVPEHFNRAWRILHEQGRIEWREVPEGTGKMLELLADGHCDLALLLTSGSVAGAARGVPIKILSSWVDSPLHWGVHVPAASEWHSAEDIRGRRVAISRHGSGSHLMAGLYAREHHWPQPVDYVLVNTLNGARAAFAEGRADVFLWERATTAPFVRSGEFRRVDVIPTPWPCFVACAHREASEALRARLKDLIARALTIARALACRPSAAREFAAEYRLSLRDTEQWLEITRWPEHVGVDLDMLGGVSDTLLSLGLIEAAADIGALTGGLRND